MSQALSAKQQCFAEEYVKDFNGKAAAIRAGYSEKSAKQQACQLLDDTQVQEAVAKAIEARSKRTGIDADFVLQRLAEEIHADFADLFDDMGRLRAISEWPPVWRKGLVVGVESFEEYQGCGKERKAVGTVRKIKLTDRIKHIELIGKHVNVNAFPNRMEVSGRNGAPVPVAHTEMSQDQFRQIAEEVAEKF